LEHRLDVLHSSTTRIRCDLGLDKIWRHPSAYAVGHDTSIVRVFTFQSIRDTRSVARGSRRFCAAVRTLDIRRDENEVARVTDTKFGRK
jgi:hypothetical protein